MPLAARRSDSAAQPPRGLSRALLAGLLGLLCLGVGALAANAHREGRRAALAAWNERLSAAADAHKASVEAWLAERQADVEILAWDADLVSLCVEQSCPKGYDLSRPQSHLDNLRQFGAFLGAYLFTASGEVLLTATGGMEPCPSLPPKVREVASRRRHLLHDVHEAADCHELVMGFLAPVFHTSGARARPADAPVVGVVGLYLDPRKSLYPLLSGGSTGLPGVDIYLVRRDGAGVRFLSPPADAADRIGTVLAPGTRGETVEAAAVEGVGAVGPFVDFRGRRVVAATRWLPGPQWGLVVKVDEEAALAGWRRAAVQEVATEALGLLCLGLLGSALWRSWSVRRYRALVASLSDREERLRALAVGTEDVVFFKDGEGRYLLVNAPAERLLGVSAAQAVGRPARDFLPPDVADLVDGHDAEVLATARPFQGEEVIPVEGQARTFLSARIPLLGAGGQVQGVAGVLRDITERKRSEEVLARRARRLAVLYRLSEELAQAFEPRRLLEAALDGAADVLGFDAAGVVVVEGERVTQAASRNLEGPFLRFAEPGAEVRGVARRALRSGRPEFVEDYAADGDAVPEAAAAVGGGSVAFVPLPAEGRVLGVLSVVCLRERHAFDEEERGVLEALGHLVGGALARARSRQALAEEAAERRRAEERLRRLHESTAGLTGHRLFAEVARALREELGARRVEVTRVGPDGQGTPLAAFEDGAPCLREQFRLLGTPCGEVAEKRRLVHYESGAWRAFPDAAALRRQRAEFYVGSPLLDSRGDLIGVLCAYGDEAGRLGSSQSDLLELYARRVAGEVERMQTEERLAEARRAFDTVIQNLPGAVYRTGGGPDRPVEYISPGCEPLTGHPAAAFTAAGGLTLGSLAVAEDRARVARGIEVALASSAPYELEYRIHDRAGRIRWVYDVGRPVALADGGAALEGVLLDHTERRMLEAQLTHSQRMEALGRLAGGVAHDFNNLLTAISGYAELLARRLPEGDRSHRPVGEIAKAADRAADLTRQLLAFSRRQNVEPKVLDFNESVAGTIQMLGRLLGEDVDLVLDFGAGVGAVRADPGQLEQVALNLCVNARDAMPGGGRLTVRTRVEVVDRPQPGLSLDAGEYAVLEVSDTGVGVPPEVRDHIFEPFFTTKEAGKGTGLGLATVYGVVSQAGGRVTVSSEVGRGTTFLVYWPLSRSVASAEEPSAREAVCSGEGTRVLLAEDEESVRVLTADYLSGLGYAVEAVSNGEEALRRAASARPVDVVITDVVMPGLSGPDLVRALRRERPDLPVVFISGHTGDALVERGMGETGTQFLQKPFRLADLTRVLEGALGR